VRIPLPSQDKYQNAYQMVMNSLESLTQLRENEMMREYTSVQRIVMKNVSVTERDTETVQCIKQHIELISSALIKMNILQRENLWQIRTIIEDMLPTIILRLIFHLTGIPHR